MDMNRSITPLATSLERPFLDGLLTLKLSSKAWEFPFADFAEELARAHRGVIEVRLGALGIDEVYWDIRFGEHVLTLHSQHFLGVYLCATDQPSEKLLHDFIPFAETYLGRSRSLWARLRSAVRALRHVAP